MSIEDRILADQVKNPRDPVWSLTRDELLQAAKRHKTLGSIYVKDGMPFDAKMSFELAMALKKAADRMS